MREDERGGRDDTRNRELPSTTTRRSLPFLLAPSTPRLTIAIALSPLLFLLFPLLDTLLHRPFPVFVLLFSAKTYKA